MYQDVPELTRKEHLSEIERYKSNIRSLSIGDTNDNDLKIFDTILLRNKVLMLGENTHYDGQTLKAKSRLIKYLHENQGYNIVLYEAGQFDTWIMNEEMNKHNKSKIAADSVGGLGLFYWWWANEETQPLFRYYLKTKLSSSPIEIGGFDIQFSGSLLEDKRTSQLKHFLEKNKISIEKYPLFNKYNDNLNFLLDNAYVNKTLNAQQKTQFLEEISGLEQAVLKLEQTKENTIYARYLNDVRNNYHKSWEYEPGTWPSMNYRDSLMARNLIYQIDSVYKDQKIIVWCANIHTFSRRFSKDFLPLGAYIKKKYGVASYMLSFSSYARHYAENKVVNKPGKQAIENDFHNTKSPYFFIDFKNIPANSFLKNHFVSTINQGMDQKKQWSKFTDGIFYIDINKNPSYPEKK
ncbi:erythromycin esterase family protein [Pedobacter steynii]|nr:erythromycin esterase family protein [Pedobacter steynii]NQX43145.1 erythromycin esterase family protein [Pedobacter steynii]